MEALRWILLLAGAVLVGAIYWRGRQQERVTGGDSLFERARRGLSRDGRDAEAEHAARVDPDMDVDDADLGGIDFAAREEPAPDAEPVAPGAPAGEAPEASADAGGEVPGAGAGVSGATAERDEREPASGAAPPEEPDPIRPSAERVVVLYVVAPAGERLVGSRLLEALERRGLRHGAHSIFHAGDSEGSTVFSVANAVDPGTFDRSTMDTLSTPGVAFFLQVPGPQAAETAFDRMLETARGVADDLEARVLDEQHSTLTRQTEQHLREELRLFDRRTGQP